MSVAALVVCGLFMVIGPTLIMLNQFILKSMNFPYPMALAGMGVLASGLFARALVMLGYVQIQRAEAIDGWLWYQRVLPVGMASAATLAFGNMVRLSLYLSTTIIDVCVLFRSTCTWMWDSFRCLSRLHQLF